MSFPKNISIEINRYDKLYQVIMYRSKVKVKTYSPDLKTALIKAVDYFETKFTEYINKDLIIK